MNVTLSSVAASAILALGLAISALPASAQTRPHASGHTSFNARHMSRHHSGFERYHHRHEHHPHHEQMRHMFRR